MDAFIEGVKIELTKEQIAKIEKRRKHLCFKSSLRAQCDFLIS